MSQVDHRIRCIEVETKQPIHTNRYTQYVMVYTVAILKSHLPSLLLHPQTCLKVFEGSVHLAYTYSFLRMYYLAEIAVDGFVYSVV